MSDYEPNIYQQYISELEIFEHTLNEDTVANFEEWKSKIMEELTQGQKIRIMRLKFYEFISREEFPY